MLRIGVIGLAAIIAALELAAPVHAYLDPGTGSALLQGVIGAVAIASGFIAYQWHRLRGLFTRRSKKDSRNPQSE